MTDTISFKPELVQHGWDAGAPNTWFGQTLPVASGTIAIPAASVTNYRYTQIYDFGVTLDSERSLGVGVPNFYTQASQSLYFTLTLPTNLTSIPDNLQIQYYMTPPVTTGARRRTGITTARAFGDGTRASTHLQEIVTYDTTSSVWVLNGSTYDITIPFDFNTQFGDHSQDSIQTLSKTPTWDGRLNITLVLEDGEGWTINVPSDYSGGFWVGQFVPFNTGWDGRSGYVGRPVNDMKTGLPAFAEELVEDGYRDGVWTVASQWDAIDPRDVREVVFPDDEGTRKDDVPA